MILVDTSIWVDHLRSAHPHLIELLSKNSVSAHPWIIGELACGNISNRSRSSEAASIATAAPRCAGA